ncbi:hypothetical protein FDUTEX481_04061 [Tolypothrix sp. PCC 7601]|nr:hypothetical protein FDUTEX481_04061 [Tolypothrix sp. PCC 7601]
MRAETLQPSRFHVKLTPMGSALPLPSSVHHHLTICCSIEIMLAL